MTNRLYHFSILLILSALSPADSYGQQFIGLNMSDYAGIQHIPTNPAWVNTVSEGPEAMLFSVNALAGTNAFSVKKSFLYKGFGDSATANGGPPVEGSEYFRNPGVRIKHLWANIDIYGPAYAFTYKEKHHIGIYTRARQLYRAGNVGSSALGVLGQEVPEGYYGADVTFKKAGFTTHAFAEVGVTYGQILRNDYYNVVRAGVTLKYMMGFLAGSLYTDELTFNQKNGDTIGGLTGDLSLRYTYNTGAYIDKNVPNDFTSWFQRAGRSGLGIDVGWQWEYHPTGNPNAPTPYLFSVAASITDIGGIGYIGDRGSGDYTLNIANLDTASFRKLSYEDVSTYTDRVLADTNFSINQKEKAERFRVGLPTAFRLNADYNLSESFNFAVNLLLNLRGHGDGIYKPGYVNCLNFTPSVGNKNYRVGLPFTVMGYQTFAIGFNARFGPLFVGSTSLLSSLMAKQFTNLDLYTGLALKLSRKDRHFL